MGDLINQIYSFLLNEVQTNDFFATAAIAMPVSFLLYTVRRVPATIFRFFKRQWSVEVRLNSDSPEYEMALAVITEEIVWSKFTRRFIVQSRTNFDDDSVDREITAGYGMHIGAFRGKFCWVHRSEEEANQTDRFKESMVLTIMTRRRDMVRQFMMRLVEKATAKEEKDIMRQRRHMGAHWSSVYEYPKRDFASVFADDDLKTKLCGALERFENERDLYRKRGTPWHLGILLSGVPGTGKTSLIRALASKYDRVVCYLNLGSIETDEELIELVCRRRWKNEILVIEDIDVATGSAGKREDQEGADRDKKVTLSAILNVFDGMITPDGLVIVATTNRKESIDPALLRPGRFDYSFEVGPLSVERFVEMADLFDVSLPEDFDYCPMPGASLRGLLITDPSHEDIRQFFNNC